MSVPKTIIGSFGDIGGEIVKEAAKAPVDIAGKALESLGTPKGTQQQKKSSVPKPPSSEVGQKQQGPLEQLEQTSDEKIKRTIARKALEALTQKPVVQKEESIWEKKLREENEEKIKQQEQAKQVVRNKLPEIKSKKRRGDLWGLEGRKPEQSKNVRQD